MPDDEDDTIAYQLVCCGDRLIRIAKVVGHEELDLLAEDATFGVEIRDRHRDTALELLAEPRLTAGHWAGHTNQDLSLRRRSTEYRKRDDTSDEQSATDHRTGPTPKKRNTVHSRASGRKAEIYFGPADPSSPS
jgi:hypothetical protein